jgi:signal transduction histidine kinase
MHDGIGVISCSGAERALEVLAEGGAVDVIVTDLYMPRIDRWRLCRLLRSDAYRRFNSTPVFGLVLAPSDCPGLEADALALERAVGNLLQNAFKFTPDGGQITVSAEPRGNDAVITVRDTGPGIDAEKIPSLFQKFHRFETSEPHEGIGLGLYIVKELVAAHGGRTEVDSVIGKGSAFSLFLPLTLS